jgi:hypothetical protein
VLNNTAKNGPCNVAITRRVAVLKTKSWDMQSGFYTISLPNFGQKLQFHIRLLTVSIFVRLFNNSTCIAFSIVLWMS